MPGVAVVDAVLISSNKIVVSGVKLPGHEAPVLKKSEVKNLVTQSDEVSMSEPTRLSLRHSKYIVRQYPDIIYFDTKPILSLRIGPIL